MSGRNIGEVIDRIVAQIPPDKEWARQSLLFVKRDASFTAPELMYMRWNQAAEILDDAFHNETEQWALNIQDIFSGKA
jgi:hypothetical protein